MLAVSAGPSVQILEEALDLLPDLAAAGEAAPARADHRDQAIAVVYGHDPVPAPAAGPVDQQRLDVVLKRAERRVVPLVLLPRGELEPRLCRANRAQGGRDFPLS